MDTGKGSPRSTWKENTHSMKKEHGNKGNRNAAKKDKFTERVNVAVKHGTKARIRAASRGKVAPWLRGQIEKGLEI